MSRVQDENKTKQIRGKDTQNNAAVLSTKQGKTDGGMKMKNNITTKKMIVNK